MATLTGVYVFKFELKLSWFVHSSWPFTMPPFSIALCVFAPSPFDRNCTTTEIICKILQLYTVRKLVIRCAHSLSELLKKILSTHPCYGHIWLICCTRTNLFHDPFLSFGDYHTYRPDEHLQEWERIRTGNAYNTKLEFEQWEKCPVFFVPIFLKFRTLGLLALGHVFSKKWWETIRYSTVGSGFNQFYFNTTYS